MGARHTICEPSAVNVSPRVVAAVAAMYLAPLSFGAVPVISFEASRLSVAPAPANDAPTITFSIPRYTLTDRERELVASCLVLEAASQGEFGMRGVMSVIRNRSRGLPELFVSTILEEKQFSALNSITERRESVPHLIARAQRDRTWPTAMALVDEAAKETWHDPTDGATHYTRLGEHTRWTHALAMTTIIGRHAFYR